MTRLLMTVFLITLAVFITLLSIFLSKNREPAATPASARTQAVDAGNDTGVHSSAVTVHPNDAVGTPVAGDPASDSEIGPVNAPTYLEAIGLTKGFPEVEGSQTSFTLPGGLPPGGLISVAVCRNTPAGPLRRAISSQLTKAEVSPSITVGFSSPRSEHFPPNSPDIVIKQGSDGKFVFLADKSLSIKQESELLELTRQVIHFSRLSSSPTPHAPSELRSGNEVYVLRNASATQALFVSKGDALANPEPQDTIIGPLDSGLENTNARVNRIVVTTGNDGNILEIQRLIISRNLGPDPSSSMGFSVLRAIWSKNATR